MERSLPASGPFALRAWHDATATVSLDSVPDLTSALEHVAASVTRNVRLAFGRPARAREKRTLDVVAALTRQLSIQIANLPADVRVSLTRNGQKSAAVSYKVSTTRIVDNSRTGILIRLRETSGSLVLDASTIRAILTVVDSEVRQSVAEVVAADKGAVNEYAFKSFDPDSSSIEIRRAQPPEPQLSDVGSGGATMIFERGCLQLRSSPETGTEATIMFHFSGAP